VNDEMNEQLPVVTKSIPTAGALIALTGIRPTILKGRDGVKVYEFPASCEPAMVKFLQAKRLLDRMVEEASA
jgi:hypothetical protein